MLERLFKPIDIAPLVYFRVLGGLLIGIELFAGLFTHTVENLTETRFSFSYMFFEGWRPWAAPGIYALVLFGVAMAICVALGLFYRASAALLTLAITSLFLMERANYINHWYLYCLVAFLLIFLPAHRAGSLDVRRRPSILTSCVPAWTRYLLLFQIAVVYVYAGISKLNIDWLQGKPMDLWLAQRAGRPVIGVIYSQEWLPLVMSWGGVLLDLLIVPAMVWRPTRRYAFGLAVVFHLGNVATFGVATFPWFSIMATALFFPPRSFRRISLLNRILPPFRIEDYVPSPGRRRRIVAAALALYAMVQLLLPMRQWMFPGPTAWSEAGQSFAWRMMLRSKWGSCVFQVRDPVAGTVTLEYPHHYITNHQYRDMTGKPDMILQFAHFLVAEYERRGVKAVEVRAQCRVSLNGRPLQSLIDPEVDLAKERRRLGPHPWLMPPPRDDADRSLPE